MLVSLGPLAPPRGLGVAPVNAGANASGMALQGFLLEGFPGLLDRLRPLLLVPTALCSPHQSGCHTVL